MQHIRRGLIVPITGERTRSVERRSLGGITNTSRAYLSATLQQLRQFLSTQAISTSSGGSTCLDCVLTRAVKVSFYRPTLANELSPLSRPPTHRRTLPVELPYSRPASSTPYSNPYFVFQLLIIEQSHTRTALSSGWKRPGSGTP